MGEWSHGTCGFAVTLHYVVARLATRDATYRPRSRDRERDPSVRRTHDAMIKRESLNLWIQNSIVTCQYELCTQEKFDCRRFSLDIYILVFLNIDSQLEKEYKATGCPPLAASFCTPADISTPIKMFRSLLVFGGDLPDRFIRRSLAVLLI